MSAWSTIKYPEKRPKHVTFDLNPYVCMEDQQIPMKKSGERPEHVITLDQAQDHWNTFDLRWLETVGPDWLRNAEELTPKGQIDILSSFLYTGHANTLFTRVVNSRQNVGGYCYVHSTVPAVF